MLKEEVTRATHITLTEGGDWYEVDSTISPAVTARQFASYTQMQRLYLSFNYKKAKTVRKAQASAVKFSDGTIYDNQTATWR